MDGWEFQLLSETLYKYWRVQDQSKEYWRTLEEATTFYGSFTQPITSLDRTGPSDSFHGVVLPDKKKKSISSCSDSIREYSKRSKRKSLRWANTHFRDNLMYELSRIQTRDPSIFILPLKQPKSKSKTKTPTQEPGKTKSKPCHQKADKEKTEEECVEDAIIKLETIFNDLNKRTKKERRTSIPFKPIQKYPINSLSSAESRFVSWFHIPLRYYEPLTILQKAAEVYEYSNLLDIASCIINEDKQLIYVAAFSVVPYARAPFRIAWQFMPIPGETYEWDRTDDMGWRLLSEQVNMVPPVAAQFCEGLDWECRQQFYYRVIYLKHYLILCKQTGVFNLTFKSTGRIYTWTTSIAIMIDSRNGKSWIHNIPNYVVSNASSETKKVCQFLFVTYDLYLERKALVKGIIPDNNGDAKWILQGIWNNKLELSRVKSKYSKFLEQIIKNPGYCSHKPIVIWIESELPKNARFFYNFSQFTCQLNENDELVAPTDSRRRPDVRAFENGDWHTCDELKKWFLRRYISKVPGFLIIRDFDYIKSIQSEKDDYLENYQPFWYKRRVLRPGLPGSYKYSYTGSEDVQEVYHPMWFKKLPNPKAKDVVYTYRGEKYWTYKILQEWEHCPEAF